MIHSVNFFKDKIFIHSKVISNPLLFRIAIFLLLMIYIYPLCTDSLLIGISFILYDYIPLVFIIDVTIENSVQMNLFKFLIQIVKPVAESNVLFESLLHYIIQQLTWKLFH